MGPKQAVLFLIIFFISFAGVIAALVIPGWQDLLLIAVPSTIASVLLLLHRWFRRKQQDTRSWVVLDGSNVMHWKDGKPKLETVKEVLDHLSELGFTCGVMFDANAGYLVSGMYVHDAGFGRALGLPEDRVMVVPKGTPADPTILTAARDLGARIVTNDRFRDWVGDFPEINEPGLLIRGGYRSGRLWLNVDAEQRDSDQPNEGLAATQ